MTNDDFRNLQPGTLLKRHTDLIVIVANLPDDPQGNKRKSYFQFDTKKIQVAWEEYCGSYSEISQ